MRHQLDIRINNISKVKLTPENDRSPYTQSVAVPINLREDLTVAHALMQRNSRTTTISFFKHANQLIEQRNQNGKCRLLVDLLIINELEFDDYTNNSNHPVSTTHMKSNTCRGHRLPQHVVPKVRNILSGVLKR